MYHRIVSPGAAVAILRANIFEHRYEEGDEFNIIAPLLSSLAKLICSNPPKSSSSSTRSDTSFTVTGDPDTQSVAVQCVATLFKREDIRRLAWSREVESNSKSHEGQTNGDTKDESRAKVISRYIHALMMIQILMKNIKVSLPSCDSVPPVHPARGAQLLPIRVDPMELPRYLPPWAVWHLNYSITWVSLFGY